MCYCIATMAEIKCRLSSRWRMTATLSMADAAIALVLVHCRITSLVRGYEATESPASAKNTCGPRLYVRVGLKMCMCIRSIKFAVA